MKAKKRGLGRPIIVGLVYFFFFVVLVIGVIMYLQASYPELENIFQDTIFYVIIFGSILALFGALTAYFEKGETLRLVSGITKAAILIAYVLVVYYSLDLTLEIDTVTADVSFPGIIKLKLILIILYGAYYSFEYFFYRSEVKQDKDQLAS